MSSTGVRETNSNEKRIIKGLILNEAQFIQSLRVFANSSTLSGLGSTEGEINNSPIDASGNYLSRLGDTMLGPLALAPPLDFTIEIDENNTIDIGPLNDNSQYTSNVQLDSIQPNGFVLDIIANAAFDGQLLFLRTFAPSTPFTISQATLSNGGNIQTGDGNDLTVGDLQIVTLIFDAALIIEANTGGSWRVLSVSSGGAGTGVSFPIDFPEEQRGTVGSSTEIIDFTQSDRHYVIMELNGDIGLSLINTTADRGQISSIKLRQDGTGGHIFTGFTQTVGNEQVIIDAINDNNAPGDFTEFVVEFTDGLFTAYLKTGNIVTGGGGTPFSGNLSDLVIDVNKDWSAQGISNFGSLTGVTGIDFDGVAATIQGLSNLDFFQASHSINSLSGSMIFQVDTSDFLGFFAGGIEIARFDDTTGLTIVGSHVINMGNNIINTISELQFSNANAHTPSNELSIAFDTNDDALKYSVALTTDVHMFFADTDLLATFSRVGTNEGLLSIQAVTATSLQATETLFLSTFNNTSPTNGDVWRDSGTGEFQFQENGVTVGLGGTAGANTSLSNLTTTSVNQDLIPDQATGGNLGSGTATQEWFNLFSRRVTFPVATSLGASDYTFGRVASPDRVQYNVPTGAVHIWTINGTNEMELSSAELILNGVNLDMENNSITDANQIQITGSSGDIVRGFLTGAAGVFDITANENSGVIRLFARESGGTLNQLLTIDGNTQSTTVGFGVAALLKFGLTGNVPSISRISDDLQINSPSGVIDLQVAASSIITITSSDINILQDLDMDNNVTVDWATTQSTVGAAGAADVLPNRPSSYVIIKVNGTEFVIPAFAKS